MSGAPPSTPSPSTPTAIRNATNVVVVVYHVTIVAVGHGLLKKFWPLVLGCVLRTAGITTTLYVQKVLLYKIGQEFLNIQYIAYIL